MNPADALKRAAAREALQRVRSGMRLGLGSGSTMWHFVDLLGDALAEGTLEGIVGVPTSRLIEQQARERGIELAPLHVASPLDLAVDGADEVTPGLELIKGLGGALIREKMVVQSTRRFVVVADESKRVDRLGTRSPLPVEVVRFGWETHLPTMERLGGIGALRVGHDGEPVITDNGNYIVDCTFRDGISDPFEVESILRARAGIVGTGLFLDLADEAILAGDIGLDILVRGGAP